MLRVSSSAKSKFENQIRALASFEISSTRRLQLRVIYCTVTFLVDSKYYHDQPAFIMTNSTASTASTNDYPKDSKTPPSTPQPSLNASQPEKGKLPLHNVVSRNSVDSAKSSDELLKKERKEATRNLTTKEIFDCRCHPFTS